MDCDLSLYLIADSNLCEPSSMFDIVALAVQAGVSCVQLRMKKAPSNQVIAYGTKLLEQLRPKRIPVIINDYLAIAKKINADGVHIGQHDVDYRKARRYLGHQKIIGLSIENSKQARQYQKADIDYFGVGPIYSTTTKLDATPPIAITGLKEIIAMLPKPIVAIGGITHHNVLAVMQTGVTGVAVGAAIMAAASPAIAAKGFFEKIKQYRNG